VQHEPQEIVGAISFDLSGLAELQLNNKTGRQIQIVTNIGSLKEHTFMDFPRAGKIQFENRQRRQRGKWLTPSASSSTIITNWDYMRPTSFAPNEAKNIVLSYLEAVRFLMHTDQIDVGNADHFRIGVEIIIGAENDARKRFIFFSPWSRVDDLNL
jgi:hypothetical protein